jgi:hypothetical protein
MTIGEHDRSGDGWHGSIGGYCPLHGYGVVDGHTWYFRARGRRWGFGVAAEPGNEARHEDMAIEAAIDVPDAGWSCGEQWGTWPDAGYMPLETAWVFIEASIQRWRIEMKT